MRSALSLAILLLVIAVPQAMAEDFTGAYAGVNAGYGFERGPNAKGPNQADVSKSAVTPSNDLPPSAATAARSMQQARPTSSR